MSSILVRAAGAARRTSRIWPAASRLGGVRARAFSAPTSPLGGWEPTHGAVAPELLAGGAASEPALGADASALLLSELADAHAARFAVDGGELSGETISFEAPQLHDSAVAALLEPPLDGAMAESVGGAADAVAAALAVVEPAQPLFATVTSYPPDVMLSLLNALHTHAGLPWWGAIVGLTITLRALLFPLNLDGMRTAAKLARIAPEVALAQAKLQRAVGAGATEAELRAIQAEMVGVYSRHGVSPLAALRLPLVQLPLFLSAIWALQRAGDVFPSMATGGPSAAFRDLTVADPSYLLPAITSASMLIAMEAAMLGMPAAPDEAGARTQRIMRTALRAMSVASLPLMANLPQGLLFYWISNNSLTLVQTVALRLPAVRTALRLPDLPTHAGAQAQSAANAAGGAALPPWAAKPLADGGVGPTHEQAARLAETAAALSRTGRDDAALSLLRNALELAEGRVPPLAADAAPDAPDAPPAAPAATGGAPAGGLQVSAPAAGGPALAAFGGAAAGAAGAQPYAGHAFSLRVQLARQLVRLGRFADAEVEARATVDALGGGAAAGAPAAGSIEAVRALVALADALEGRGGDGARAEASALFGRALDAATQPGGVGYGHELVLHALIRKDALATAAPAAAAAPAGGGVDRAEQQ